MATSPLPAKPGRRQVERLPLYPGPAHPERLPGAPRETPVRPLDDDPPPQPAESPAEQAARDSWLDAEGRRQLALAHDSIAKLDALLSVTIPGPFRNILLNERASWLSFADAQQQRPYQLLRTHYKVRPGQPDVATLLRMRPDGRYEIAVRTRGITTPKHSYGDRASAEFQFEQMT